MHGVVEYQERTRMCVFLPLEHNAWHKVCAQEKKKKKHVWSETEEE